MSGRFSSPNTPKEPFPSTVLELLQTLRLRTPELLLRQLLPLLETGARHEPT